MDALAVLAIEVSEHALWRACERFGICRAEQIEGEVRAALAAGRVTTDRRTFGLSSGSDPKSLYVRTLSGVRVYAVRVDEFDETRFVVTTTMRRKHG